MMQNLALKLGCKIGSFPFTYLGLPLNLSKPRLEDFVPVMQRIDRRLVGCSTLLSYGDKLTLIKSVFTCLPTFFISTLSLPAGITEQINKYLEKIWGGEQMSSSDFLGQSMLTQRSRGAGSVAAWPLE